MIEQSIKKLVCYGLEKKLIEKEDIIYVTNRILNLLKIEEYNEPVENYENIELEEIKSRKLTATKFEVTLKLKIKDREDLERLIANIQAESYIDYVTRNNLN